MTNLERLSGVIEAVSERMQDVSTPAMDDQGRILLEISGTLLRGCLESARGVEALAKADEYGGSISAERTGWEMWRELEYLLTADDTGGAAVKARANAAIELLTEMEDFEPPPGMRDQLQATLADLRTKFPAMVAGVERQRAERRFHWSGERNRSAVVATKNTPHARVYRMLSWEAHPGTCFVRDIETVERDGRTVLQFRDGDDDNRSLERSAWAASEYLQRAWNLFAQAWGLEEIDFPLPEAP